MYSCVVSVGRMWVGLACGMCAANNSLLAMNSFSMWLVTRKVSHVCIRTSLNSQFR